MVHIPGKLGCLCSPRLHLEALRESITLGIGIVCAPVLRQSQLFGLYYPSETGGLFVKNGTRMEWSTFCGQAALRTHEGIAEINQTHGTRLVNHGP